MRSGDEMAAEAAGFAVQYQVRTLPKKGWISILPLLSLAARNSMRNAKKITWLLVLICLCGFASSAFAGEADIKIPDLTTVKFSGLGGVSGIALMYFGIVMCAIGAIFGLVQYKQTKALPVHESMGNVSNTIWETCKTYLFQQGKFLVILWVLIAACIFFYFQNLEQQPFGNVVVILLASILGILGSYGVAWFG